MIPYRHKINIMLFLFIFFSFSVYKIVVFDSILSFKKENTEHICLSKKIKKKSWQKDKGVDLFDFFVL